MIVQPRHVAPGEIPQNLGAPRSQGQETFGSSRVTAVVGLAASSLTLHRRRQHELHRPRRRPAPSRPQPVRALRRSVPLQYDVCVRARPPEAADARQRWRDHRRGGHAVGSAVTCRGSRFPVESPEFGVSVVARCAWDHSPCFIASATLISAAEPGRGLQVSEVRLHRPDQQRPLGRATRGRRPFATSPPQLDRIAHRRSRSVRLDVVDLPPASTSARRQRIDDDLLLRRPARHRQARDSRRPGSAPLPCTTAQMRSPSASASLEPLQHQDPAALAPHVAVGGRVERGLQRPSG